MRGHRSHRPLTRVVFALLAVLAFALGSTEVHSASADHLAGRGLGGQIADGASHPFDAHHVESSETRVHPPCPACLLQLQTVAVGLTAPAVLPLPSGENAQAGPTRTCRLRPLSRLGSPRGPPALAGR
ncbi:MAG TPA: hypothetical protein VFE33_15295 [Thermoanaerobaculia bacterium]|nr:hypothetical protein [Thermoanaerobaculia bacterium]